MITPFKVVIVGEGLVPSLIQNNPAKDLKTENRPLYTLYTQGRFSVMPFQLLYLKPKIRVFLVPKGEIGAPDVVKKNEGETVLRYAFVMVVET